MEKGRAGAVLVTCRPWQAALSARPCLGHRASPQPTWRKACAESRAYAWGANASLHWQVGCSAGGSWPGSESTTQAPRAAHAWLPGSCFPSSWRQDLGVQAVLESTLCCKLILWTLSSHLTTASASSPLQGLCCASAR